MKKNTTAEALLLITGILFLLLSLFPDDLLTQRMLKGGLYLFTAAALTSKIIRFFPTLNQKRKFLWMGGCFLTYVAAALSLVSEFKGVYYLWLMGILLFSLSSYPENKNEQEAGV